MEPLTPPKVIGVEVVATRPTESDSVVIAHLSAEAKRPLPQVAYIVKVRFKAMPPVTSQGWALYVNDFRIPKYWEYKHGIYFKVFDPQFFADYKGKRLRFSQNGTEFIDTGTRLAAPAQPPAKATGKAGRLPLQAQVLK